MAKHISPVDIAGRMVGAGHSPFLVAEMSGNHNQSLERALSIIESAAESGAHAIKLQTYTAGTMTLDIRSDDFIVNDEKSLWNGKSLYELYDMAHTPWDWHEPIFQRAKELGLVVFSTPFDHTAVDFLETLDVPCYKIASFENTDLDLIRKVAQTGKPLIISTGMANPSDLHEAIVAVRETSSSQVILLKCTSTYPASPDDSNILTIPHMMDLFDCNIGLSDHTLGIGVPLAAIAHGACFVEKHFTLARSEGGVDSAFSLEPAEFAILAEEAERAWRGLGHVKYGQSSSEKSSKIFKRSLYIVKDMKKGDRLTHDCVRAIRPGHGAAVKYLEDFIGLTLTCDVELGTPVNWKLFK